MLVLRAGLLYLKFLLFAIGHKDVREEFLQGGGATNEDEVNAAIEVSDTYEYDAALCYVSSLSSTTSVGRCAVIGCP